MQRVRAGLAGLAVAGAMACTSAGSSPTEPTTAPYMAGRITAIVASSATVGSIRVESNPQSSSQGLKAVASVDAVTVVLLPGKKSGDLRSLVTGQWVRLWFDGAISQSYPVQGVAATIIVDSLTVTPTGG